MSAGVLHHVEMFVSNLEASVELWGWFLGELGYKPFEKWEGGESFRLGPTYFVFVQVEDAHQEPPYHRKKVGLNHLAFRADSREQVDALTVALKERGVRILYEDRHPFAGGPEHYGVFFEDPDRMKIEVVAPRLKKEGS